MRRAIRHISSIWQTCTAMLGVLTIGLLSASAASALQHQPATHFTGPFPVREALTFYVVNETGVDFTIHMSWQYEHQSRADWPTLVRVFDPAEQLLLRYDEPGLRSAAPPKHHAVLPIKANGAGVYQVAVRNFGGAVHFATEPPLPFGLYGYPRLGGTADQFAESHVYLPPGLDRLRVRIEGEINELRFVDEANAAQLELRGMNPTGEVRLPAATAERIWRLSIKGQRQPDTEFKIDFGSAPIILCPDEHTARAIHASVDILDDGTICFHKFQRRIHQILQQYRKAHPRTFSVTPPPLMQYKAAWEAQPQRNQLLLGAYGAYATLPAVLQEQNLSSADPLFGTIRAFAGESPGNPWSSYSRLGLNRAAQTVGVLAAVYSINEPFNPLYRHRALLHRIIIASLQELMLLREHELPFDEFTSYHGGERAFMLSSFTRAFPLVINDCPDIVRRVWTEGLRRYVDHETVTSVASNVNQWAQLLLGIQHFRDGVDDAWYGEMVERHIRWILDRNHWDLGFMKPGYFNEAEGPDSTYVGITLHALAFVYERTRHQRLGESLRQCINLFNHTVAPQPSAHASEKPEWLGVSSFNHRTPGDWSYPQFGAGIGMLADDFAEASPLLDRAWLARSPPRSAQQQRDAELHLNEALAYFDRSVFSSPHAGMNVVAAGPDLHFAVWEHFAMRPLSGELPMVAEARFTRNFGDEFFCVRRPDYYAFTYAAATMGDWQKPRRPSDPRRQHPRNAGGLCMFWTPAFGSSILAQNWAAYAANSVIVEHNGAGAWEDYWSVKSQFDSDGSATITTGALIGQPIQFQRRLEFKEQRVECTLTLEAVDACAFDAMWESFPYSKDAHVRVQAVDDDGRPAGNRPASAIVFRNRSNQAHIIVFDQPRTCNDATDFGIDAYEKRREYGRTLAAIPSQWAAGQRRTLRWSIMAVPADAINATIRETVHRYRRTN